MILPTLFPALVAALLFIGLPGCDLIVEVENVPPRVEALTYCAQDDAIFIRLNIQDTEAAPIDVELVANLEGERARLPTGPAGDGLQGLRSQRFGGVVHLVEWGDTCAPAERPPLGQISRCQPRPSPPPTSLSALVILAFDGDDLTTTAPVDLSLQPTCAP